jgi:hypothetical protein
MKDGTWVKQSRYADHGGDGYAQDHNSVSGEARDWGATKGIEYEVRVSGGTYAVCLRRFVPSVWGSDLGGSRSNSAWLGVDGEPLGGFDDAESGFDQWTWVRVGAPINLSASAHVLNLRVREGGYAVDRILLTTDEAFVPSGVGPDETLRAR